MTGAGLGTVPGEPLHGCGGAATVIDALPPP